MRSTLVALVLFLPLATLACAPGYDLVIRNGDLVDGTGSPARRVDVAIKGDRIVVVGTVSGSARRTIDASGRVVAPGFIDVQGQSGTSLLTDGNGESHIRQGITTEIIGEAATPGLWTEDTRAAFRAARGYDWTGFDGYLHTVESRGTSINLGSFAPIAAIREQVLKMDDRAPTPDELGREEGILERAMQQGAFGFATALIYPPASYTSTDELISLARVASKYGGVYISHVRGESFRVKEAIGEAIEIGRKASLPVVIYHLKIGAKANWGRMDDIRAEIEGARARGVDVTACQYPYTAGGTGLPAMLPGWAQEGGRDSMLERLRTPTNARRCAATSRRTPKSRTCSLGATFDGVQIASLPAGKDQSIRRQAALADCRGTQHGQLGHALLVLLTEYEGRSARCSI